MTSNVFFIISGLCISLLINIVYFSKKRVPSYETKLYGYLITTNFLGLIIEFLCSVVYKFSTNEILHNFIVKLYLIYLVGWAILFMYYVFIITYKSYEKFRKKMIKITNIIFALISIFLIILPIEHVKNGNVFYAIGMGVVMTYVSTGICVFVLLTIMIINAKKIKNKKYFPLLTFIVLATFVSILQSMYPELLMITAMEAYVLLMMFFTIENPDVKMLEEVELAREQADKANQAKLEFLSSMSHEIRTPLNAIVGFSQNLYEEDISLVAKEQVKDIITASNNLLELVNGILDISKIEANRLEIVNEEYSFRRVFNELVSLGHARLGDKALIFKTQYDESIPMVLYGDKLRIKQVILNILTNSIKYTKKGFIEFKVSSIIKDDICRLIISVEDSGVGIKKENIDKLFTKFQRFEDRNTTIEGTGLGLAITKKLVELMNGQIIVQSVYGQGSKFTIAIDQSIVKNPTINLDDNAPIALTDETFNLSGKKVLVVDDNNLNLKVASKLLEKYNLELELVNSGFECVNNIIAGKKYDLILLDDMMPKMSGVETFKELKKDPNYKIPTVILTANAIAGMRDKYIEKDGFDDYLAKPIEKAELNRVLKEFLMKEE